MVAGGASEWSVMDINGLRVSANKGIYRLTNYARGPNRLPGFFVFRP